MKGSINSFIVGADAFVDLTTAQTIGGAKTFTSKLNATLGLGFSGGDFAAGSISTDANWGAYIVGRSGLNADIALVTNDGLKRVILKSNGSFLTPNNTLDDGTGKAIFIGTVSFGNTAGQKLYIYESGTIKAGFGVDMSPGGSRELTMFHTSSNHSDGRMSFGHRYETDGTYTERMYLSGDGTVVFNGAPTVYNQNGSNPQYVFRRSAALAVAAPQFHLEMGRYAGVQGDIASFDGINFNRLLSFRHDTKAVTTANNTVDDGVGNATIAGALTVNGAGGSFANSKAANGYQKLPGGLIIQWGFVTNVPGNSTISGGVTFPIAFPTACTSVIPAAQTTGNYATITSVGPAQCTIYNNGPSASGIYWQAMGY